jgi:hypothetical protein
MAMHELGFHQNVTQALVMHCNILINQDLDELRTPAPVMVGQHLIYRLEASDFSNPPAQAEQSTAHSAEHYVESFSLLSHCTRKISGKALITSVVFNLVLLQCNIT